MNEHRTCTVEGCEAKHHGADLCRRHFDRKRRGTLLDAPWGPRERKPRKKGDRPYGRTTCQVAGCERPHSAKGFCASHYRRDRLGQDMLRPIRPQRATAECGTKAGHNRHLRLREPACAACLAINLTLVKAYRNRKGGE